MKRKEASEIMMQVKEEYQEDPRGWSFWISHESEPPEIYIIHREDAFFLKINSIYTPKPIGIGAKFKLERDQLPENLPEFGFRPLQREEIEKIFDNLPYIEEIKTEQELRGALREAQRRIFEEIQKKKPIPFSYNKDEAVTIGPYSIGGPLKYVSDKQRELKEKLEKELEKLERQRYPGYA